MEKNTNHLPDSFTSTDKLDIIGDIHGCYFTLLDLLIKLGYKFNGSYWFNPLGRRAIFIGDYIDRGIFSYQVLHLIKNMVDNCQALAILGNHEYNFIAINTINPLTGKPFRPEYKLKQHQATILSIPHTQIPFWINWFKSLPIYLEFNNLRLIHAYWDSDLIKKLNNLAPDNKINSHLNLLDRNSPDSKILTTLIKGPEFPNMGNSDHSGERFFWWMDFNEKSLPYLDQVTTLKIHKKVPQNFFSLFSQYPKSEKCLIFGHYSLDSFPHILKSNLTTVDFGVYKKKYLCAYRFTSCPLSEKNLICVPYNPKDLIMKKPN